MPLMPSKSKKAFKNNVETEMEAGKSQPQSLAIAYNVKTKPKKKMAKGGEVSASNESRPMPDSTHQDSKSVSRNSNQKAAKEDSWTDTPTETQAKRPSTTPLSRPKMANGLYTVRDRDDVDKENMLEIAMPPGSPDEQPAKEYDEDGAERQGPAISDMQEEHSNGRKPYAEGGRIFSNVDPSEDEGAMTAEEHNEASQEQTSGNPDMEDEHSNGSRPYAQGGEVSPEDEEMEDHYDSIAAAIMAKKERQMQLNSDSDEDSMVKMADGGILSHDSIYSDDSDQADLKRNAQEDANEEDQSSFNALRKENYSTNYMDKSQPMDSNEHGHTLSDEDAHDLVQKIRSKMNMKRQFGNK